MNIRQIKKQFLKHSSLDMVFIKHTPYEYIFCPLFQYDKFVRKYQEKLRRK